MRIYLVRHGETDWNIVRKLQGRTDIPLNEKGIKAAQKTGEALRNVPFTRAFSSPLKRAMDTAKLILGDRQI
ncbi:histidine phosphatase family protein, partial [[Clostridium] scindens]|uniref:histidine phosphatase family protein n=1 Tax=Clostridium scindens (strain JCM 10418 / VPI 12708) TaxID=29347 RepID=UPI003AB6A80D